MTCRLCGRRKARRACPALGHDICSVCCGTKRLIEIRCPESCGYLASSRHHPPAIVQREQARDVSALLAGMRDLTEAQRRLCFLLLSVVVGYESVSSLERLTDADITDACGALASTYETAARGVIYEHRPQSLPAQRLAAALRDMLDDIAREAGVRTVERDARAALRSIESGGKSAAAVLGPSPTAYLELLRRIVPARSPSTGLGTEGQTHAPGLILPPG